MNLEAAKTAARKAGFDRRKAAKTAGADKAAAEALQDALAPYAGAALAGYMPIRTEVDPLPVMAGWDGPVGVPVISAAGQPLRFRTWTQGCAMVAGPFGAAVPADGDWILPDVVIVPLVAWSRAGERLGYGGGFYDRTLEGLRARGRVTAIGFAFAAQEAKALPMEPTDQPLDMMVTDAGVLRF